MTEDNFAKNVVLDFRNGKVSINTDIPFFGMDLVKKDLKEHYTNGLSKYIQKISVEVVDDISECEKIWKYFSSNKSLFDNWDFRMQFFKGYSVKPYFLVIKRGSSILACLPLMYQENIKKFTWFGSDWMENNVFFAVNTSYIPLLLYFAPKPVTLQGLNKETINSVPEFITFKKDDPDYYLNLEELGNMDNFLKSLMKKRRYNLKRDYKKISSLNPIFVKGKKYEKEFFSLIAKRMHSIGEKVYFEVDPGNKKAFENIFNYKGKEFLVDFWTVFIGKEIAVSDIIAIHNNTIYPLLGANNVAKYSGVGNFINYYEIEKSFIEGFKKIDYLQYDYGWKNKYLKEEPRYLIDL